MAKTWVLIFEDGRYSVQKQEDRGYGSYADVGLAQSMADWLNSNLETVWPYPVSAKPVAPSKPKVRPKHLKGIK